MMPKSTYPMALLGLMLLASSTQQVGVLLIIEITDMTACCVLR